MEKPYISEFRRNLTEISDEVKSVLKITARKMKYQEYDLKAERIVVDEEKQTIAFIPSKEDSYERLLQMAEQFKDETSDVEEEVIKKMEIQVLYSSIRLLSADEQQLLLKIFVEERTERELAEEYGVSQNMINKRKQNILGKLKKMMKDFF